MSLNDEDLAKRLKEYLAQSNLTRKGGNNYANSEEIPLGGGGSDREQIIKNRKQNAKKDTTGKIKYAYTTVGSTFTSTALYVAGFQDKVSIKVDEWGSGSFNLQGVCLDNLGGRSFIISYTLRRLSTPQNYINKVAKHNGASFSVETDQSYYTIVFFTSALLQLPIGHGNWCYNEGLVNVMEGNPYTTNARTILICDPNINTRNPTLTETPYSFTTYNDANNSLLDGYYQPYLSPTTKDNGRFYRSSYSPRVGVAYTTYDYHTRTPIRYNRLIDKGLFLYDDDINYSATAIDQVYSFTGTRVGGAGWVKNGVINKIQYYDVFTNAYGPRALNRTLCNTVAGSNVVTLTRGHAINVPDPKIPPVGAVVSVSGFPRTTVQATNGNTVILKDTATTTSTYPNEALMTWEFALASTYVGVELQVDITNAGFSQLWILLLIKDTVQQTAPNGSKYSIASLSKNNIKIPINLYGDDLLYKKTITEVVYKPKKVGINSTGRSVFSVLAASYHP